MAPTKMPKGARRFRSYNKHSQGARLKFGRPKEARILSIKFLSSSRWQDEEARTVASNSIGEKIIPRTRFFREGRIGAGRAGGPFAGSLHRACVGSVAPN